MLNIQANQRLEVESSCKSQACRFCLNNAFAKLTSARSVGWMCNCFRHTLCCFRYMRRKSHPKTSYGIRDGWKAHQNYTTSSVSFQRGLRTSRCVVGLRTHFGSSLSLSTRPCFKNLRVGATPPALLTMAGSRDRKCSDNDGDTVTRGGASPSVSEDEESERFRPSCDACNKLCFGG